MNTYEDYTIIDDCLEYMPRKSPKYDEFSDDLTTKESLIRLIHRAWSDLQAYNSISRKNSIHIYNERHIPIDEDLLAANPFIVIKGFSRKAINKLRARAEKIAQTEELLNNFMSIVQSNAAISIDENTKTIVESNISYLKEEVKKLEYDRERYQMSLRDFKRCYIDFDNVKFTQVAVGPSQDGIGINQNATISVTFICELIIPDVSSSSNKVVWFPTCFHLVKFYNDQLFNVSSSMHSTCKHKDKLLIDSGRCSGQIGSSRATYVDITFDIKTEGENLYFNGERTKSCRKSEF